ncbi:winged helix DNA-binding domain-containing protein, partial [Pluteus cervinus]
RMLEEKTFRDILCWSPAGDCFVVRDVNEFTKLILPRMFKHSNFASFVRQLNKYDFHKVKNGQDSQFGEQSWIFRHPDFQAGRREVLENVKRKIPSARKHASQVQASVSSSSVVASASHNPHSSTRPLSPSPITSIPFPQAQTFHSHVDRLQGQVRVLQDRNEEMLVRLRSLEQGYKELLVEMVGLQRKVATQDSLLKNLIQNFASGGGTPAVFTNQSGMSRSSSQFG